jgi:hypothetical protein
MRYWRCRHADGLVQPMSMRWPSTPRTGSQGDEWDGELFEAVFGELLVPEVGQLWGLVAGCW